MKTNYLPLSVANAIVIAMVVATVFFITAPNIIALTTAILVYTTRWIICIWIKSSITKQEHQPRC